MGDLGASRGDRGQGSASLSLPQRQDPGTPWIKKSKNLIEENPAIWACNTCWDSNFPDRNARKAISPADAQKPVWGMTVTIDLSSGAFNISTQVRDLESFAVGTRPLLAAAGSLPTANVSIPVVIVPIAVAILLSAILVFALAVKEKKKHLSGTQLLAAPSPGRGKIEGKELELDTLQRVDSRRSSPIRSPVAPDSSQSNLECFFRPFPASNVSDDEADTQVAEKVEILEPVLWDVYESSTSPVEMFANPLISSDAMEDKPLVPETLDFDEESMAESSIRYTDDGDSDMEEIELDEEEGEEEDSPSSGAQPSEHSDPDVDLLSIYCSRPASTETTEPTHLVENPIHVLSRKATQATAASFASVEIQEILGSLLDDGHDMQHEENQKGVDLLPMHVPPESSDIAADNTLRKIKSQFMKRVLPSDDPMRSVFISPNKPLVTQDMLPRRYPTKHSPYHSRVSGTNMDSRSDKFNICFPKSVPLSSSVVKPARQLSEGGGTRPPKLSTELPPRSASASRLSPMARSVGELTSPPRSSPLCRPGGLSFTSVSLFGENEEDHAERLLFPKPFSQGGMQVEADSSLTPVSVTLAVLPVTDSHGRTTSASNASDGLTADASEPPAPETPALETPALEPPALEPPASEPPVPEAPASEPPALEPLAYEAPPSEPPASEPPASETPASETPASEPPVPEPPASEPPASEPHALEPPIPETPASDLPVPEPLASAEPPAPEPPALAVRAPMMVDELAGPCLSALPPPMASVQNTMALPSSMMEAEECGGTILPSTPFLEASNPVLGCVAMRMVVAEMDSPLDLMACGSPPTAAVQPVDRPIAEVASTEEETVHSLASPPPSPLASPQLSSTPATPSSVLSTPSRSSVALLRSYYSNIALGKSPSMTPKSSEKQLGASSPNKRFDSGLYSRLNVSRPMSFSQESPSHRLAMGGGKNWGGLASAEEVSEEVWSFEEDEMNLDSTAGTSSSGVARRG